jgi:protein subunit release factor A
MTTSQIREGSTDRIDGMSEDESESRVPDLEQLEKEVEITAYQASGPGGQHRNRTFSAIRAKHLPTGIVVTAADSRSQLRNRKIALERLRERLVEHFHEDPPRRTTRKGRAVREREKLERQRESEKKKLRRKPEI